ncbi:MAG: DMT family protein [Kiritimatiellae bacterium]|nr:DMT family protein [Kiritimatiellia bacterium]
MSFFGNISLICVILLACSNLVMLYAWYGHLKSLSGAPVWVVILVSWLIALGEYCLMVPANRIGAQTMSLEQLKILQEAIALLMFVPFSVFVMKEPVSWNYAAASLCIFGAVYFIFRA